MHNRTVTSETGTRHHMTSSPTLIIYQKLLSTNFMAESAINPQIFISKHTRNRFLFVPPPYSQCEHDVFTIWIHNIFLGLIFLFFEIFFFLHQRNFYFISIAHAAFCSKSSTEHPHTRGLQGPLIDKLRIFDSRFHWTVERKMKKIEDELMFHKIPLKRLAIWDEKADRSSQTGFSQPTELKYFFQFPVSKGKERMREKVKKIETATAVCESINCACMSDDAYQQQRGKWSYHCSKVN